MAELDTCPGVLDPRPHAPPSHSAGPHTCPPAPPGSPYCPLLTVEGVGAWLQLPLGGQDNEEVPTPGGSSHRDASLRGRAVPLRVLGRALGYDRQGAGVAAAVAAARGQATQGTVGWREAGAPGEGDLGLRVAPLSPAVVGMPLPGPGPVGRLLGHDLA